MNRIVSEIMISLLLINVSALLCNVQLARAVPTTIIVPDDYSTIQRAINAANPGDIVLVKNGTYHEHIVINKTITLVGENPSDTIIDGDAVHYTPIMMINESDVIVQNLTIRNTNSTVDTYGILVSNAENVSLFNMTVTEAYRGIVLNNAEYCQVSESQISNNYAYGITLLPTCQYDNFTDDNIVSNPIGAWLALSCTNNTLFHNNFVSNLVQVDTANYGTYTKWDNGYPSGGNYWSDYTGNDTKSVPYQNLTGSDGIGDTPYNNGGAYDRYPLMKPYPWNPRSIGITKVSIYRTIVGQGSNLSIDIMVFNFGNSTETFNGTAYTNLAEIGTNETTLTDGNFADLKFSWNTANFAYGNYTIWASTTSVSGEADTDDNNLKASSSVEITILGDVDGNHVVNILDVVKITSIYASKVGERRFNPNCDLDGDGKITILDLATCIAHYGKRWP